MAEPSSKDPIGDSRSSMKKQHSKLQNSTRYVDKEARSAWVVLCLFRTRLSQEYKAAEKIARSKQLKRRDGFHLCDEFIAFESVDVSSAGENPPIEVVLEGVTIRHGQPQPSVGF